MPLTHLGQVPGIAAEYGIRHHIAADASLTGSIRAHILGPPMGEKGNQPRRVALPEPPTVSS